MSLSTNRRTQKVIQKFSNKPENVLWRIGVRSSAVIAILAAQWSWVYFTSNTRSKYVQRDAQTEEGGWWRELTDSRSRSSLSMYLYCIRSSNFFRLMGRLKVYRRIIFNLAAVRCVKERLFREYQRNPRRYQKIRSITSPAPGINKIPFKIFSKGSMTPGKMLSALWPVLGEHKSTEKWQGPKDARADPLGSVDRHSQSNLSKSKEWDVKAAVQAKSTKARGLWTAR